MGKVLVWAFDFLQRWQTNGWYELKKMLNSTSHQGNINPNHNEMPSLTCQGGYETTVKQKKKVGEDVEKWDPHALLVGLWDTAAVESIVGFLRALKTEPPYDPAIQPLNICPKEWKQGLKQIPAHPRRVTVARIIAAEGQGNLRVPGWMGSILAQWNMIQPQKEEILRCAPAQVRTLY